MAAESTENRLAPDGTSDAKPVEKKISKKSRLSFEKALPVYFKHKQKNKIVETFAEPLAAELFSAIMLVSHSSDYLASKFSKENEFKRIYKLLKKSYGENKVNEKLKFEFDLNLKRLSALHERKAKQKLKKLLGKKTQEYEYMIKNGKKKSRKISFRLLGEKHLKIMNAINATCEL